MLRFDDLLAARLVAQQLPAESERLASHLADLSTAVVASGSGAIVASGSSASSDAGRIGRIARRIVTMATIFVR